LTQDFIDRCVASAADLALFFTGIPENEMMAALYQVRANIEAELAGMFAPDVAAAIAHAMVAAVAGRRREIDAGGAMAGVVN
jgi:hypothetical protein